MSCSVFTLAGDWCEIPPTPCFDSALFHVDPMVQMSLRLRSSCSGFALKSLTEERREGRLSLLLLLILMMMMIIMITIMIKIMIIIIIMIMMCFYKSAQNFFFE